MLNVLVDTERMTNRPTFTIVQPRARWTRVSDGTFRREYVARRSDGQLRLILCRDDNLTPGMVAA